VVLTTAMTEVAANEEVSDEPVVPGLISTPMSASINEARILAKKDQEPGGNKVSTEQTGVASQQRQKAENKQRMIREIAANQLLQEELAKHDPNLACVASFLSKVCWTSRETKKLQDAARIAIQKGVSPDVMGEVTGEVLKGGLSALPIVTAVTDVKAGTIAIVECIDPTVPPTTLIALDVLTTSAINRVVNAVFTSPDVETNGVEILVIDESDAVSLADTVMSAGGSSSDGDRSPSPCSSSVSATGTRKRFADESPERAQREHSRRKFSGHVTRSATGCRVYLPPVGDGENQSRKQGYKLSGNLVETVGGNRESSGEDVIWNGIPGNAAATIESSETAPVPSSFLLTSTPDPCDVQTVGNRCRLDTLPKPDFFGPNEVVSNATDRLAVIPVMRNTVVLEPEPVRVIVLVDEWGRDTCVINEICELLESMPRPWSAYRAIEAASAQFPNIDRAALRLALMAVLMGQRRCVNRITTAGIGSACADDYRNSY